MIKSKSTTQYVCKFCQGTFVRWQGQCSDCGAWNSLNETTVTPSAEGRLDIAASKEGVLPLKSVSIREESVLKTGISEMDQVLGKGLVEGSVILLGGEPGVGKSTLALQIAMNVARTGRSVLYISGEESLSQLLMRALRIGEMPDTLLVLSQNNIQHIKRAIKDSAPDLVILDSIQVVFHPEVPSVSGSVNQVRQCAQELISVLKSSQTTGIFIGHITKEGQLAGPKVLEHLVDVVLFFEGDRNQQFRLLRSYKNRFASTQEVGIFTIEKDGLKEVENPSQMFVDQSTVTHPGSVVSPVLEGSRAMLVEVQALVVKSSYGMAKRTILGVDSLRANLLVAVIEKILEIPLSTQDIILNVVGGVKISEPALDLAVCTAILSSLKSVRFQNGIACIGEVGLTGEIRGVSHPLQRLKELYKMGFKTAVLPMKNKEQITLADYPGIIYADHISDVYQALFKQ